MPSNYKTNFTKKTMKIIIKVFFILAVNIIESYKGIYFELLIQESKKWHFTSTQTLPR